MLMSHLPLPAEMEAKALTSVNFKLSLNADDNSLSSGESKKNGSFCVEKELKNISDTYNFTFSCVLFSFKICP